MLGPVAFINHDCKPHGQFSAHVDGSIAFKICRNIKAGEEITVSYGPKYFDNNTCKCLTCENRMNRKRSAAADKNDEPSRKRDWCSDENTGNADVGIIEAHDSGATVDTDEADITVDASDTTDDAADKTDDASDNTDDAVDNTDTELSINDAIEMYPIALLGDDAADHVVCDFSDAEATESGPIIEPDLSQSHQIINDVVYFGYRRKVSGGNNSSTRICSVGSSPKYIGTST